MELNAFHLSLVTTILFPLFAEYLKPIAAQEREVEAARAKERAELEAIRKAEAAKGLSCLGHHLLIAYSRYDPGLLKQ